MLRIKITQNYRKNREANDEFRALSIQRPAQCTKLDMYSIRPAKKQRSGRETHRTGEHLGYIILRERTPACEHRVSDTVVKPPKTFRGDRGERFLTCSVRIGTRETGRPATRRASIQTYPFIQKMDGQRFACAYAVLRMFGGWLWNTKNPFITLSPQTRRNWASGKAPTMPEFERRRTAPTGPGLTADDFVDMLKQLGLDPIRYIYNDPVAAHVPVAPPDQLAYSYVESGLPVFFIFKTGEIWGASTPTQLHIVTVVGHTFDRDAWWPAAQHGYYFKKGPGYIRSLEWVDFLIHDDNFGPFRTLPKNFLNMDMSIYSVPDCLKTLDPSQNQAVIDHVRNEMIKSSRVCELIIPFRKEYVRADLAEASALNALRTFGNNPIYESVLQRITNPVDQTTAKHWKNQVLNHMNTSGRLVLRTFLVTKKQLPQNILITEKFSNIRRDFGSLPDHLWMTEISTPELHSNGQRIGMVLQDAMHRVQDIKNAHLELTRFMWLPGLHLNWNEHGKGIVSVSPLIEPTDHFTHTIRDYATKQQ